MNTLAKAKSDKRAIEVRDQVANGDIIECAEAKVASGIQKRKPVVPVIPAET